MLKKIKINKPTKIAMIVAIIIVIIFIVYNSLYNINNIAQGEYINSVDSFNKDYTVNAYIIHGGNFSKDSIRVEVVNNKTSKKKNIYYECPKNTVDMQWISQDTVDINGKILNVNKDIYDWRQINKNSNIK